MFILTSSKSDFIKFIIVLFFCVVPLYTKATVQYQFTTSHYSFTADNTDDLLNKIKVQGPKYGDRNSWALINWDLNTEYHFSSNDNGCTLITDKIMIKAEVTLPLWENIEHTTQTIQHWWQEFYNFIETHENNHFNNVYQIATALEKKLAQLQPAPSCKQAKQNYLDLKHQQLDILMVLDKTLDKKAQQLFFSSEKLFSPLKQGTKIFFESGGMSSYIGI